MPAISINLVAGTAATMVLIRYSELISKAKAFWSLGNSSVDFQLLKDESVCPLATAQWMKTTIACCLDHKSSPTGHAAHGTPPEGCNQRLHRPQEVDGSWEVPTFSKQALGRRDCLGLLA